MSDLIFMYFFKYVMLKQLFRDGYLHISDMPVIFIKLFLVTKLITKEFIFANSIDLKTLSFYSFWWKL